MTTSERPDQEPETPSQQPPSQPIGGTGRLAQVIATRGGLAPPEAPFVIEHREALIYMLCEAAELEHGIMCQYLFAVFSLKQDDGEGLTEAELAATRRWRKVISRVATQEMLHLALVQNLLTAIGAAPHLSRPNFPHPSGHYPAGVHLALLPFGEEAVRHFMFLERPEGMDIRDADGMAAFGRAQPLMEAGDIVPRGQDFKTIGHMYRSIEAGFRHLAEQHGEDWLFVGPPRAQATPEYFGWPELVPVTDLASAQRAIDEILEQGEGPRGAWQEAHFGQFVEVLDEYLQAKEANLGLEATRPVQTVNVRPCDQDVEVPLCSDLVTARVMDLFNVAYEVLLQIFERFFAHTDESDTQLKTLADATVGLMLRVIKPLGDLITTLPAGSDYPGQTAGPSFELFYESDYLLPHRDAAWALLAERLHVAAGFAQEIIIGDTGAGGPVLTPEQVAAGAGDPTPASERVAAVVEPAGAALATLAATLAAFLPPSDPHSPAATGPDSVRTAGPADPDLAALQARANDFHLTGPDGLRPGDLTADLAQDIEQAWLITSELLAPGSHADRHWAAARLVDSVLRPLADTLRATTTTQPAPSTPATAKPAGADERIWQLAQGVTRQHVRWAQAGTAPAGLTEATAGLQGIACDLAPGADRRAALRELQAALPAGIQVAPDGPYLVTNVATVHDYLGQDVPVPPQLALCRCGASGRKPFCDGSHAPSGFTGDKDPKRVPDHRDRYDGEQVTVFDNRGICQHSGFCTDRLNTVFRTDAEPFVAPSGGRMDEIIRAVRDCPSGALGLALDDREQRDLADWHGDRPAAIEISQDGPYRVTGSITLTTPDSAGPDSAGPAGADVPRAQGASREHYALCRCGHSQNKPFCSGMHWYIGFTDPDVAPGRVPSLFEWAGGLPALTQLTRRLYEKLVPADPQLARVFADIPPGYPEREAARIAAAFGGPRPAMPPAPANSTGPGAEPAAEQRARWVMLATQAADETGLPADVEFRAAFTSFLAWDAPGALARGQAGGAPAESGQDGAAPPVWDWSAAGPPDTAQQPDIEEPDQPVAQPVILPGPDEPVSFARHIKPMFRAKDRQSMLFALDLWSYDAVRTNASDVLARVANGSMPCDGSWPDAQVQVFRRWTETGTPA
jgi:CDGSH-type Zn-finger protein/truncated hemoglobin YjbI